MASMNLNGRLKALERQVDRAAVCPDCDGVMVYGLGPGEPMPSWLDEQSCCRRCGTGVKVVSQRFFGLLA